MREQPSSDTLDDTYPSPPVSQYSCDKTRVKRLSLQMQRPSVVESRRIDRVKAAKREEAFQLSSICQAIVGRWRMLRAVGTWGSTKMKEAARGFRLMIWQHDKFV